MSSPFIPPSVYQQLDAEGRLNNDRDTRPRQSPSQPTYWMPPPGSDRSMPYIPNPSPSFSVPEPFDYRTSPIPPTPASSPNSMAEGPRMPEPRPYIPLPRPRQQAPSYSPSGEESYNGAPESYVSTPAGAFPTTYLPAPRPTDMGRLNGPYNDVPPPYEDLRNDARYPPRSYDPSFGSSSQRPGTTYSQGYLPQFWQADTSPYQFPETRDEYREQRYSR